MLILLSPAKSLNTEAGQIKENTTEPRLLTDSFKLVKVLREYGVEALRDLMHISEPLAIENVKRYKDFRRKHTLDNSKAAIEMFDGDVYRGLEADQFSTDDMASAQAHIRILSGLYGVLRPLDIMQEYRLEMGTRLTTERGTNLYQFWGDKITKLLNKDLKESGSDLIVNLASNEYFKSINKKKLKGQLIEANFKEYRDGELKFISFNAKKARGTMARYLIQNEIRDIDGIKGFNLDDYHYSEELSKEHELIFVR